MSSHKMGKGLTGSTLWLVIIIGFFLVIDMVIAVLIIVESGKLSKCTGSQSLFCPFFTCGSIMNTTGNGYVDGNPDPNKGFTKCSSYMYRLIDPNKSDTDYNNIECNLPLGGGKIGGPTVKAS
jgi:hypothetical protein